MTLGASGGHQWVGPVGVVIGSSGCDKRVGLVNVVTGLWMYCLLYTS